MNTKFKAKNSVLFLTLTLTTNKYIWSEIIYLAYLFLL